MYMFGDSSRVKKTIVPSLLKAQDGLTTVYSTPPTDDFIKSLVIFRILMAEWPTQVRLFWNTHLALILSTWDVLSPREQSFGSL